MVDALIVNASTLCVLNPFQQAEPDRANAITAQIDPERHASLFAFDGCPIRLAPMSSELQSHTQRPMVDSSEKLRLGSG